MSRPFFCLGSRRIELAGEGAGSGFLGVMRKAR